MLQPLGTSVYESAAHTLWCIFTRHAHTVVAAELLCKFMLSLGFKEMPWVPHSLRSRGKPSFAEGLLLRSILQEVLTH